MLLSRSLTSDSGKCRSTRASPSTSPEREKYPTPELNRTTRVTGRLTAGLTSCLFSSALSSRSVPTPTPTAPNAGTAHNSLRRRMAITPKKRPLVRGGTPQATFPEDNRRREADNPATPPELQPGDSGGRIVLP